MILLEEKEESVIKLKSSLERQIKLPELSSRALVVMGVRRCGKTNIAHSLCAQGGQYLSINFDDERLMDFQAKDFDLLLQVGAELFPENRVLLLDEAQNVLGWELFANRVLRKGYRLVVTGSNARLLSKELATHLTGRSRTLELFPFSWSEFLSIKSLPFQVGTDTVLAPEKKAKVMMLFEEYLKKGGFPEVVIKHFDSSYLRELYEKILIKDIAARYNLREIRTLRELSLSLINNLAGRMTFQKSAKALSIKSVTTVRKYCDALEEAYLLTLLSSFHSKAKEIIRSPKKVYPIDLGLHESLNLAVSNEKGRKLEGFVFLELRRRGCEIFSGLDADFEVDFVVRKGVAVEQLIQVCHSLADPETRARELKGLNLASKKYHCKNLTILTFDETESVSDLSLGKGVSVQVLPAWRWALEKAT